MKTAADYRTMAEECLRWAREARPERATIWPKLTRQSPTTVFPIWGRSSDRPQMHTRDKARFTCRRCAAPVEADAGICHCCEVAYPTSALRAVVLSPISFAFLVRGV
jgi:hypothetical protein